MSGGPIDDFLAELTRHLRGDDEARRRIEAEVAEHLCDLIAEGRSRGLDEHAAESEAIEKFGSPRALGRALRPARRRSRTLRVSAAVAIAAACEVAAFAVESTTAEIGRPLAERVLNRCASRPHSVSRPGAGGVVTSIRSVIDADTGHVLTCPRGTALWLTGTMTHPVERSPKGPVTMAAALHQ